MAFLNRVGNALKQTVRKHVSSQFPAANASLFQAMRSMSTSSKLFVGGLSYSTDETSLREAFAQYGEVVEARVIMDRETGRSRGFAFVTFTSSEAASSAIQAFDGQDLHGRTVRVNYATERPRGGGFGGGYGGAGGGGYGGGGYGGGGYGGGGYGGGYGGRGGNYGGGGYQGGNYQGGGGGYGSGSNQYQGGGGGCYGVSDNYPSGGGSGGYGGADTVQGGGLGAFSSGLGSETVGETQDPMGGHQAGDVEGGNDDFGQDANVESNDYANTRR